MTLTAPVNGTVQQLAIHTVGGVVTPAQALMVIVPAEKSLEAEVFFDNKDIGFLNTGLRADIKVETFPYTKYGTIDAEVLRVSQDAIDDQNRGFVFAGRIRLHRTDVQVENKLMKLSAGMAVTAEVKTGRRKIIEYFLSPLLQYKHDSLRER